MVFIRVAESEAVYDHLRLKLRCRGCPVRLELDVVSEYLLCC